MALRLHQAHPDADPAAVPYAQLRGWVQALAGFADDPREAHEELLDDIQREWLDLIKHPAGGERPA